MLPVIDSEGGLYLQQDSFLMYSQDLGATWAQLGVMPKEITNFDAGKNYLFVGAFGNGGVIYTSPIKKSEWTLRTNVEPSGMGFDFRKWIVGPNDRVGVQVEYDTKAMIWSVDQGLSSIDGTSLGVHPVSEDLDIDFNAFDRAGFSYLSVRGFSDRGGPDAIMTVHLRSSDYGFHWSAIDTLYYSRFFIPSARIGVLPYDQLIRVTNDTVEQLSTDHASTWSSIGKAPGFGLNEFAYDPSHRIYAQFGDTVYRSDDLMGITTTTSRPTELTLSPNPALRSATLHYHSSTSSTIDVELVNVLGEVVLHPRATSEHMSDHTLQLDLSSLAEGVYLCRVTSGSELSTVRFVKVGR